MVSEGLKACLILPPSPALAEPEMQVPLGVLYVAASLEACGIRTHIADFRSSKKIHVKILPKSDLYGFSSTSPQFYFCKSAAQEIKKRHPSAITVIGGPHATIMPRECEPFFDAVVVGEGEYAMRKIALDGKRGIVEGELVRNLDELPFPARHLLPPSKVCTYELYPGHGHGMGPPATAIIATRGCPYSCAFCANWDRTIRYRSPENVVAEIREIIARYNCTHFRFVDDCMTINRARTIALCRALEPLGIRYRCHTRSTILDDEMAYWLKRSGCEEMALGVECADNRVLDLLNKRESVEDHERAIKIIKDAGMRVKVYLMVCLPGETWDTIKMDMQFMARTKPDKWSLWTFVPYPGCEIWNNPGKFGVKILNRDYSRYWQSDGNWPSVIETDVASNKELIEHRRVLEAYLKSGEWRK